MNVARWAERLDAWAIPQHLLDAVDESPYGWPQQLWKRRRDTVTSGEPPTTTIVHRLAHGGGSIIDVGAGRGRASLPLAVRGHPLRAVEPDPGMAAGMREDADALGLEVEVIEDRWPAAAERLSPAAVVMSANVVYDVRDIGPFVAAMHRLAERGVVIEMTAVHPWASMAPLYRALHGIERPEGPTVDDLVAVVEEIVGVSPTVDRWQRTGEMWFADWDEIIDYIGRRAVLPLERRHELRPLLEPDVVERDGKLFVGGIDRSLATVWWSRGLE